MGIVSRFERRLQGAVGDGLARVFGGSVVPKEVEAALQQEAADQIRQLDGGHALAPNSYVIAINTADYEQLAADHDLTVRAFARHLQDYIREQGWQTYGDIRVRFEASPTLHTGQFRTSGAVDPDIGREPPDPNRRPAARPSANPLSGAGSMTQNSGYDPRREPADSDNERRGRAEYPGEPRNGARGFATPLSGGRGGYQNGSYPPPDSARPEYGRPERPHQNGGYSSGGYQNGYESSPEYQNGYEQPARPAGYPQDGYGRGQQPAEYDRGGYAEPGYSEPAYGEQGYAEPGYQNPAYPGSGYAEPGYSEPAYGEQGYGEQGYAEPGYQNPGYPDRSGGYGEQAYGASGYADQGYAEQSYAEPGYQNPAYPGYDDAPQPYGAPADRGGYAEPTGYGQPAGYDQQPAGYDQQPAYDQRPAYGQDAGYSTGGRPAAGYAPANGAPSGYSAAGYTASLQLDDGSGRTYQLREGSNIIGRGQDAHFRLPDTGVSRRHIEVRWDGQVAMLSDLGSTNGTLVNGSPVQDWQLADGDVIRAGHSEILIRIL